MAPKWNPETDPIQENEAIGRRLFDEPMLMGARQQPAYNGLRVDHFEETREDKELSLDRLGSTGVARAAKRYLIPRAEYSAKKFRKPKTFNGWAVVSAKHLKEGVGGYKFPVVHSPQRNTNLDADDLENNIYHAHCVLPEGIQSISIALHIRHIFSTKGKIEHHQVGRTEESLVSRSIRAIDAIWTKLKAVCTPASRNCV